MADYIYTMESRLSPEQMRTTNLVQSIARAHGANIYLTGGAIRDILTGFPIRDLDFTVHGNPLEFRHELEKAGGIVDLVDTHTNTLHAVFEGIGIEISMARAELFDKPGRPSAVTPATINEDLRRRDFTCNAMALSLNEGSRGLLLDPFNGAADIEARLLRILHSYAFLEEPSRLIRATRFATRFGWEMEERTRARYDSARENDYSQFISRQAVGYEIEQIAHEENPIPVMQALEQQGWLKVLWPKWTVARANVPELAELLKLRATMADCNIRVHAAPAVLHFLTVKLGASEVAALQKLIPHRELLSAWKRLDPDAKELAKKLVSREASLNSGAWKVLSAAKPEALLYLGVTTRSKTVLEKIRNFFGKWRQLQEKIPLTQMAELRITPQLPEYADLCRTAFFLLLDGKLRSESEIQKFLAPFEPPPPPPAPLRRSRTTAKRAGAAAAGAKVQSEAAKPLALAAKAGEGSSQTAPPRSAGTAASAGTASAGGGHPARAGRNSSAKGSAAPARKGSGKAAAKPSPAKKSAKAAKSKAPAKKQAKRVKLSAPAAKAGKSKAKTATVKGGKTSGKKSPAKKTGKGPAGKPLQKKPSPKKKAVAKKASKAAAKAGKAGKKKGGRR